MASSDDPASGRDVDAPAGELTSPVAEPSPSAEVRDVIAMGVAAVMALHSIKEAKARPVLAEVAIRHRVPVSVVAQAVLAIVAGTDKPFGDPAGRAAAQLLVQDFTNSP